MFTTHTEEKLYNYTINNLDVSLQSRNLFWKREGFNCNMCLLWMNNKQKSWFTLKDPIVENPNHRNLLGSFPPAFKQKHNITNGISYQYSGNACNLKQDFCMTTPSCNNLQSEQARQWLEKLGIRGQTGKGIQVFKLQTVTKLHCRE